MINETRFIRRVKHRRRGVRRDHQRNPEARARHRRPEVTRRGVDDAEGSSSSSSFLVPAVEGREEQRLRAVETEGVDAGGGIGLVEWFGRGGAR